MEWVSTPEAVRTKQALLDVKQTFQILGFSFGSTHAILGLGSLQIELKTEWLQGTYLIGRLAHSAKKTNNLGQFTSVIEVNRS